eukprot:4908539-Amphidinium_carterae.2
MEVQDTEQTFCLQYDGITAGERISLFLLCTKSESSYQWHLRHLLSDAACNSTGHQSLYQVLKQHYDNWVQIVERAGFTAEEHIGRSTQSLKCK